MMRYVFYGLKEIEYCTGEKQCGFVGEAGTFPKRALDTARLRLTGKGVQITETADTMWRENENHFNYGGLAYRVLLPEAGAYHIEVTTTSSPEVTEVSLSGMQGDLLRLENPWDAAGKVARLGTARWREGTAGQGDACWIWSYDFVCGKQPLEVEVEVSASKAREILEAAGGTARTGESLGDAEGPAAIGGLGSVDIGLAAIQVTSIPVNMLRPGEFPTVFILGDSTAKSYVFEEAPMSSWGQIFYRFLGRIG